MEQIVISVSKHTWLDCSVSWFLHINGVKAGNEFYSEIDAIENGRELAKELNGTFDEEIINTNEMFV